MPHTYAKQGIKFLYPDNWTVDEGEPVEGGAVVTVYSPGGSFWSIVLEPASVDPADMAVAALKALKSEYEDCDSEPMSETVAGHEIRGYDANFFCLDLTSTAAIRGFRTSAASCLVLWQAEDRDLAAHEPVFRAITISLLTNDR